MPNIRDYTNPIDKLNPDEKAYQAREMAGRRIGPLFNQAAADVEKGGKLAGQLNSQAMRANDLQVKALDEPGLSGSKTPREHIGSISSGGGGRGGGGRPLVDPGGWAGTARDVTGAAYNAISNGQNHGNDGHFSKLLDVGGTGAPLYTTGAADSTPTASGSYSQQLGEGLSGGTDMTPAQVASELKQGDALYQRYVQGLMEQSNWSPATLPYRTQSPAGITDQPSPADMAAGAAGLPSIWDNVVSLATRGYNGLRPDGYASAAIPPEPSASAAIPPEPSASAAIPPAPSSAYAPLLPGGEE